MTDPKRQRVAATGISIGIFPTGPKAAMVDVPGVLVAHTTMIEGECTRTGVTAILPHSGNLFQEKVPAAIHIGNGFGKLAGFTQVEELGNLETPIILTNTLSVPTAADALIDWTLQQPGNEEVRSVNALVGETNDGQLNDIRSRHVTKDHVLRAIKSASATNIEEGNCGAGTGTICFGWKGGIGTSSRVLPQKFGGYTIGVLAQTNFGGVLQVGGVSVGVALGRHDFHNPDGSCMMVVATDAPLDARNLKRLAARAMLGLARTGGIASNGSGDYVIAFSTQNQIPHDSRQRDHSITSLRNDAMSPLFQGVIEATEEAILNSMFMAETMTGFKGKKVEALPLDKVLELVQKDKP